MEKKQLKPQVPPKPDGLSMRANLIRRLQYCPTLFPSEIAYLAESKTTNLPSSDSHGIYDHLCIDHFNVPPGIRTLNLQCPHCGLRSLDTSSLHSHLLQEHHLGPFVCMVKDCSLKRNGGSFQLAEQLSGHMKKHYVNSDKTGAMLIWKCDAANCDVECRTESAMAYHIWLHHQRGTFECTLGQCALPHGKRYVSTVNRAEVMRHIHKVHYDVFWAFQTSNRPFRNSVLKPMLVIMNRCR